MSAPKSPVERPPKPTEPIMNPQQSPSQPQSEASTDSQTSEKTAKSADTESATALETGRQLPIPPPSEPLQYRAIGLIRGIYMPSVEQFTQGTLLATDSTLIDAVLLGRVMSLLKNHLNLAEPHLWVVYPRTRKEDNKLHVQIVGVWEPEKLTMSTQPSDSASRSRVVAVEDTFATDSPLNGYFSIRGEVVFQAKEEEDVFIKIIQAPRKQTDTPKFFKLKLKCSLPEKMVGRFWDFQVRREGDDLVVQEGKEIAQLRIKKKKPMQGKKPGNKKSFSSKPRGDKPTAVTPPKRTGPPPPKPVKKQAPPQ